MMMSSFPKRLPENGARESLMTSPVVHDLGYITENPFLVSVYVVASKERFNLWCCGAAAAGGVAGTGGGVGVVAAGAAGVVAAGGCGCRRRRRRRRFGCRCARYGYCRHYQDKNCYDD